MPQDFDFSMSDNGPGRSTQPRSPKAAMREQAMMGHSRRSDPPMDDFDIHSRYRRADDFAEPRRSELTDDDLDLSDMRNRNPRRGSRRPPVNEEYSANLSEDDMFEEEQSPRQKPAPRNRKTEDNVEQAKPRKRPPAKKQPVEFDFENEVDDIDQYVDEEQTQKDKYATGDQYLENATKQRDELAEKIGKKSGSIKAIIIVAIVVITIVFIFIGMRDDEPQDIAPVQLPYEEFTGDVSIGGVTYIDTFTITDKIVRKEGYTVTHYFKGNAHKFGKSIIFPISSVVYQNATVGQSMYITYSTTQMNSGGMYTDCLVNVKVVNSRIQ